MRTLYAGAAVSEVQGLSDRRRRGQRLRLAKDHLGRWRRRRQVTALEAPGRHRHGLHGFGRASGSSVAVRGDRRLRVAGRPPGPRVARLVGDPQVTGRPGVTSAYGRSGLTQRRRERADCSGACGRCRQVPNGGFRRPVGQGSDELVGPDTGRGCG